MEEARLAEEELAVLFAEAPEPVRQRALALRKTLLTPETKEQLTGPGNRQLGYAMGCNLFATLEPAGEGLAVDLWVGSERREEARAEGWSAHPHPLRAKFGWVHREIPAEGEAHELAPWIETARERARREPQR